MNRFFYVVSLAIILAITWFCGLALMGLVAKLIYRSVLIGWNLV